MKPRAVSIIIDPVAHAVLLIHRWKAGREYYVIPGGKIEVHEIPAETCVREAREETGLTITVGEPIMVINNLGRIEHYFIATSFKGELELGFPERDLITDDNVYKLEWVSAAQLEHVNLLPVEVRPLVRSLAAQGQSGT
jgi:8-oxo-dGTP diphosphatase